MCVIFKGSIENELLTFSLQIITDVSVFFSVSIRFATEVYNFMTAAQRMEEYVQLPSEDLQNKELDKKIIQEIKSNMTKEDLDLKKKLWPRQGEINFENVSMRFREGLEPAVQNLTFKV